jgi:putative (di)nucleoside polyphosphate hydrolase
MDHHKAGSKELEFDDLLVDPMIRLIMAADGIGERDILDAMGRASRVSRVEPGDEQTALGVSASQELGLRRGVGVMLVNERGQVFVGRRNDLAHEAWQMPQGGIEPYETAQEAALRELREETGITRVEILSQSAEPLGYELPSELLRLLPGAQWRGQLQTWFLMLFLGDETEIDVATEHPEFSAWKWASPDALASIIVPFKRKLYARVLSEFEPHLAEVAGAGRKA